MKKLIYILLLCILIGCSQKEDTIILKLLCAEMGAYDCVSTPGNLKISEKEVILIFKNETKNEKHFYEVISHTYDNYLLRRKNTSGVESLKIIYESTPQEIKLIDVGVDETIIYDGAVIFTSKENSFPPLKFYFSSSK